MTGRTVPLSVRVTHEDADFLSELEIDGAESPSEKLRALIAEAKRKSETESGFTEAQAELQRLIRPLVEKVQDYEVNHDRYSQLLHLGLDWIPDAMAELVAQRYKVKSMQSDEAMQLLERRIADRMFRLIEGFLRLAVTQECEGYDPEVVQKRWSRIQQLINVVQMSEKIE